MAWLVAETSEHTVPLDDLIVHELAQACVCGPQPVPVARGDGSVCWLLSHHSLDGRERREEP
ncbi:hypothetical protein [Kitasatospora sp. NPDC058478]|uniref:hypothetical protein n=1 Tax=unclassified Kitasatospora TaxID=2633591 RepID=UPI00365C75B7